MVEEDIIGGANGLVNQSTIGSQLDESQDKKLLTDERINFSGDTKEESKSPNNPTIEIADENDEEERK